MERKLTFNKNPDAYFKYRPDYPVDLYHDIFESIELDENSYLLDIGVGAGKELIPFMQKNMFIDAIDIGNNLIDYTNQKYSNYKKLNSICISFEQYPVYQSKYDIVFSATAFHWIDSNIKYDKVHKLLKENGLLALCWQRSEPEINDFENELYKFYLKKIPDICKYSKNKEIIHSNRKNEIINSGFFEIVIEKKYNWSISLNYPDYCGLFYTFSKHILINDNVKQEINKELENIFYKRNNAYNKEFQAILYICKKSKINN